MGLQRGQTASPKTLIFSVQLKLARLSASFSLSPQHKSSFIPRRVRHSKRCKWSHCTCKDISSGFLGNTKYHTRQNTGWAKALWIVQVSYFQNTVSTHSSFKENLSKDATDRLTQNFCFVAMRDLTWLLSQFRSKFSYQVKERRHTFVVNLIMGCHSQLTTFAIKQKSVFIFCS